MSKTTLRKGKQDDKFSLAIRDIQAGNAANKKCFDCEQRGPTYINTTVGSFVCTKCSGMLRGINPPHRIKSISMSSFSADEVEMMRSRGNSYCAAVWLGLFDAQPVDYKDEEKIKDFIIAKYEKKRYYVEPSQAQLSRVSSASPGPELSASSRSGLASSSLIGSTLKARMEPAGQINISVSRPGQGGAVARPLDPPRPATNGSAAPRPAPPPARPAPPAQAQQPSQPVAVPPAHINPGFRQPSHDFGNFADFDTAAFDSMPSDPLTTSLRAPGHGQQAPKEPPKLQQDKYSALAELDDLFKSTAIQSSEAVFPEPALPDPLAPAAPELFQSLLETQAAAGPHMFGAADRQPANGSPGGWGRASPGVRPGWGDGAWSDGGRLAPGPHSTNPFGTSPSNPPLGAPYTTPDNNNDLFAAAPKPFFAEKPGAVETNPWTGVPAFSASGGVGAFTADMKPAHNPNNPFL